MTLQKAAPYIFSFTLFLSATLLFSVQPMLGKMMLPHVGGAPSGWVVAMFFFQTCLLVGYLLAHLFAKMPPFLNAIAVLAMFIPSAFFLPIAYHSGLSDTISPIVVFAQLSLSVALPFLALSILAPSLQRFFSLSTHSTASDPYYLYAASNLGSFTGLLSYPLLLEPVIGLQIQSHIWMMLYGLLYSGVILCALTVFINRRDLTNFKQPTSNKNAAPQDKNKSSILWRRRLKWIALAAIPSSLMLGVTTEITTDIASAPMIWIIPLGLYLLTNIIAFAKRKIIDTKVLSTLHLLGVAVVIIYMSSNSSTETTGILTIISLLLYLGVFTITAMTLHSILANDRPQASKLTEFYLMLALGGAIGGGFNAFIAPLIFNDANEFYTVLIISLLLSPSFFKPVTPALSKMLKIIIVLSLVLIAIFSLPNINRELLSTALIFIIFFSTIHPKTLFIVSTLAFIISIVPYFSHNNFINIDRNFFGVTKVYDGKLQKFSDITVRVFQHGTTLHGFQAKEEPTAHQAKAYYGSRGPVGDVFNVYQPKNVAVLGLGTGQLSCHKARGRKYTYYEIDPNVIHIAHTYFTQLDKCGYKEIVLGDARLKLAKSDSKYDMIFVDTFSSDSIPVHLITEEAFNTYFSKMKDNGSIVINISNRHLNLKKPLSAIAKHKGYFFKSKKYVADKDHPYDLSSEWVVLTKNKRTADALEKKNWYSLDTNSKPWTDDYSNLFSTIKFFKDSREN